MQFGLKLNIFILILLIINILILILIYSGTGFKVFFSELHAPGDRGLGGTYQYSGIPIWAGT